MKFIVSLVLCFAGAFIDSFVPIGWNWLFGFLCGQIVLTVMNEMDS